jgi:hypothetical protein
MGWNGKSKFMLSRCPAGIVGVHERSDHEGYVAGYFIAAVLAHY